MSRPIPAHIRVMRRAVPEGDCLIWTGKKDRNGYGQISVIEGGVKRARVAHRVVYEAFVGPIPTGLELDHLCRNTSCVKPDHLEPVTARENSARRWEVTSSFDPRTHCINGHPWSAENTYYRPDLPNTRSCRACNRAAKARARARRRLVHT